MGHHPPQPQTDPSAPLLHVVFFSNYDDWKHSDDVIQETHFVCI
jgi:hypothetical protein